MNFGVSRLPLRNKYTFRIMSTARTNIFFIFASIRYVPKLYNRINDSIDIFSAVLIIPNYFTVNGNCLNIWDSCMITFLLYTCSVDFVCVSQCIISFSSLLYKLSDSFIEFSVLLLYHVFVLIGIFAPLLYTLICCSFLSCNWVVYW